MRLDHVTRRTALCAPAALALPGCWKPLFTWRQKLTLEVEAGGEVYTGSSVIKVFWKEAYGASMTGRPNASWMRGEAAFVDIPGKETLFALLKSPHDKGDPRRAAFWALGFAPEPGFDVESFRALSRAQGRKATLAPDQYPMLVTFDDIADPKSVREVDPQNLSGSFSGGVRLKRILLEITDEPVTELIETKLNWLSRYHANNYRLNGKSCVACPVASENLPDMMGPGNFKI
ncbi:MAG: hypothetical protein AAFX54_18835 [Pseudomonadota bacterium]